MLSDWFNRAKNEALKHIETGYFRNSNLYLKPVCWIAKHVKQRVDNDAQPCQHIGGNVHLLKKKSGWLHDQEGINVYVQQSGLHLTEPSGIGVNS